MDSQDTVNIKLAMDAPWCKEYWTFVMIPVLATIACYFIPLFRCEQGLAYLSILPLMTAISYGHILSPRKAYYEKEWKEIMDYHAFILANVKRSLIFASPTGLIAWATSFFLNGYPKELAMFFETSIWGLAVGIFIYSLTSYSAEIFKLKKTNPERHKTNLSNLWRWIFPPTIAFSLLVASKIYLLMDLLTERS